MSSSFFTKNQIKLNTIDSTNRFLLEFNKSSKISGPIVVTADYQSEGKGRTSKSWFSNRGENLLISLLINHNLHINKKFDLSILISLALKDFLSIYLNDDIHIKWPNDLIIKNKKIAGFIIDNLVQKSNIHTSVIGIGVNINQLKFNFFSPLATSISLENNCNYNLDDMKNNLLSCIENRYINFEKNSTLYNEYLNYLYLKDKFSFFEINLKRVEAKIINVSEKGELFVQFKNDKIESFLLDEIKFLF
ncbi:MAG: biotin--[acetyl-CoA-carboxylase] ligase [Flavobacteriales bacterium]|jgi:BirA family biotin operon repressor/biotin-[acetyl-CoA-carboxylase] ligase|tara:strand:+ start:406 stop:1149 length:744 start_codon:yes stop_codon:yes gene_type:complete